MNKSLRPALFLCAAFIASGLSPAQAGPNDRAAPLLASASVPKLPTPDLLSQDSEPALAGDDTLSIDDAQIGDQAPAEEGADQVTTEAAPDFGSSLPEKVAALRSANTGNAELECLAIGVYFESKGESLAGQLAVGQVIANRAKSGRFPSSYCSVLKQRGQFSFVHGGAFPSVKRASSAWKTAVAVAKIVHRDLHESKVGNALFFHAKYVSPKWRMKRVTAIGNHVFYR